MLEYICLVTNLDPVHLRNETLTFVSGSLLLRPPACFGSQSHYRAPEKTSLFELLGIDKTVNPYGIRSGQILDLKAV